MKCADCPDLNISGPKRRRCCLLSHDGERAEFERHYNLAPWQRAEEDRRRSQVVTTSGRALTRAQRRRLAKGASA